jgi:nucleotide-binding universal stress UspA family protein
VAEAIVLTSTVPTFILHIEDLADPDLTLPTPLSLLVALDGSPSAEEALPLAVTIARALHGALLLLRVVHAPAPDARADIEAAREYLETVQHRIATHGIATQTCVAMGDPATQIVQVARCEQQPADIVAMTTQSHAGRERASLGTVTEQVLHTLHRPLLLVHPSEMRPC